MGTEQVVFIVIGAPFALIGVAVVVGLLAAEVEARRARRNVREASDGEGD